MRLRLRTGGRNGHRAHPDPATVAEHHRRYLRKAGVEAELVMYPREGHELSRGGEPAHVVDRLEQIEGWFDRHAAE